DGDLGETLSYILLDDCGGLFAVDGRNLVLLGSLDGQASFNLAVRVTDSEGHALERGFTISAMDLADFAAAGAVQGGRVYYGGASNDIYYVANSADTIIEHSGQGLD